MNFGSEDGEQQLYAGVNNLPLYKGNHLPNINADMARTILKNRVRLLQYQYRESGGDGDSSAALGVEEKKTHTGGSIFRVAERSGHLNSQ